MTIRLGLRYGAEKEDAGDPLSARYKNHFHEPINGTGLDDYVGPLHITGESTLFWTQNSTAQATYLEGDQSWPTLRQIYSFALRNPTETARRALFAQLFKGLGHQMHLVQDMAVPAHVRNDAHPEESMQGDNLWYINMWVRKDPLYFETWAKNKSGIINSLASGPALFPDLNLDKAYAVVHGGTATCPISQLWDKDYYDGTNPSASTAQGLAEYTNANFFIEDTIFAAERYDTGDRHYFPYPKESSLGFDDFFNDIILPEEVWAEDGLRDFRLYIPKHGGHGEAVDHFVAVGYFSSLIAQSDYDPTLYRTFISTNCATKTTPKNSSPGQSAIRRPCSTTSSAADSRPDGPWSNTAPVSASPVSAWMSGMQPRP
ncbi:MAG: hypothetical protein HZB24_06670 [Desulfobacterales bacterium]|nr:hypothetical protein [Desulfobacterales bacterium]